MTHQEFLFQILDVLERENVPYFLFCGTLLGAVRDNDFLPNDHSDTDIGVDAAYYWKVRQIINNEIITNGSLYYKMIWRKEIGIGIKGEPYKLDIFFLDREDDQYACFSYKKSPTGRWDQEWKAWFSYRLFYPLTQIEFFGRSCNVPGQFAELLREHYGNWEVPDPHHVTGSTQKIDHNHNEFFPAGIPGTEYTPDNKEYQIGFICINFMRKQSTKECIESIQKYFPFVKVYVADQDAPSGEMIEFYEKHNVEYYYIPFDSGLSVSRNFLVDKIKEPFLMWGDNDFVFTSDSNLSHGLDILNAVPEIGFVGGAVTVNGKTAHYERFLFYDQRQQILVYVPLEMTNPEPKYVNDIAYYDCDLTFNYVIARTEAFNNPQLRWNPELKCRYEHTDAFLRIKVFSPFHVVYCPSMTVIHNHVPNDASYAQYRYRVGGSYVFGKSWNLKMNFTVGKGSEVYKTDAEAQVTPIPQESPKIEQTPKAEEINLPIKEEPELSPVLKFLSELDKHTGFWLANTTCLAAIKHKKIPCNSITLGVNNVNAKETILEAAIDKPFKVSVRIEKIKGIKKINIDGVDLNIPCPVIGYLNSLFGSDWNEK
jgi:GT2 family glycosyltransferase